ncbi:hypothetical protein DFH07DRAFT_1060172 [Mycena maculata]|uniref:Uncharacterized protein n=1 Tax=Mycena maculata TaxID=230809 RepID=A0AAD7NGD7_9AGAR|nr:hypothetical protein DFH07DRAFT_1060172 [Mycena maculata]
MFSKNPEHSDPSLSFPGSSPDSANTDGSEKHSGRLTSPGTPGLPLRASNRFNIGVFISKLKGWPAIVIGGHLIIQVAAWTFFAIVQSRKGIALPPSSANWVNNHGHAVTLISTAIATVVSTCSSYLFSLGLRRSLALHLHRDGMSLAEFMASVKISTRSLVLDPGRRRWSATSIILFILTLIQTSSFNTLIRPIRIVIEYPMNGTEIDLGSSALQQMQDSGKLDFCVKQSNNLPAFTPGQTESGYTSKSRTFDSSTAGILSLTRADLEPVDASAWFDGNNTSTGTLNVTDPAEGVSQYYTVTQQGFTANVTCEFQDDLSATGANLQTNTVEAWSTGVQSSNVTYTQLTSACAAGDNPRLNFTYGYTAGTPANASYILMVACQSGGDYTLIFLSAGMYDFMNTTVEVDYTDVNIFAGTIQTGPVKLPPSLVRSKPPIWT